MILLFLYQTEINIFVIQPRRLFGWIDLMINFLTGTIEAEFLGKLRETKLI